MASASIFTFEADPPRVASPWATATPSDGADVQASSWGEATGCSIAFDGSKIPILNYAPTTKIEAEPQEGPVEYKLHLLLRKRRSFTHSSTRRHLSGSLRRTEISSSNPMVRDATTSTPTSTTPPPLSVTSSRSNRLEQLTSQMLWRLQQSAPNHQPTSSKRVILHFQDEARYAGPIQPLYPGLEESNGALYELGVADDGELIGLADDEMEESLNNLRIMAASLGCRVEVQRVVSVGECEWIEDNGTMQQKRRKSKLLVAEAFIRPDQHFDQHRCSSTLEGLIDSNADTSLSNMIEDEKRDSVQLRVSLTGATTSGKSSLLGTLSTGTLDNGHGLSRLTLLKHKHEHESGGVTSSITQELIGYNDNLGKDVTRISTQVVNYGTTSTATWAGIHASSGTSKTGRLVFLTDSAGHPRFRRTTLRGLVGWDPHYTLLCIPADNSSLSLGSTDGDLDLSTEHLDLCLKLDLPLLVVITKFDLATKAGLKNVVSSVRKILHDAGRRTCIVADRSPSPSEADLNTISSVDLLQASKAIEDLKNSPTSTVPIILTSASKGTGLGNLHAFLRNLPVPDPPTPPLGCPTTLFHIEDTYTKSSSAGSIRSDDPTIIGGHLRYGTINIGDDLLLGPYPVDITSDDSDSGSGSGGPCRPLHQLATSRSFPGALPRRTSATSGINAASPTEWRRVRIISLRNLRQPVRTLYAGQVGTIGVSLIPVSMASGDSSILSMSSPGPPAIHRIRKGMVLVMGKPEPKATRVLRVVFEGYSAHAANTLSIGNAVVIYTASVRASSKVISVMQDDTTSNICYKVKDGIEEDDGFRFGLGMDDSITSNGDEQTNTASLTTVQFQFIASREFIEHDAKVLVMPGGGPGFHSTRERGEKGFTGLEGFVGRAMIV